MVYHTVPLTGMLPDQSNNFGTLWFDIPGIQNGPADGIAFVAENEGVFEFISYAGTMTALNGPAKGMTSIDIGVREDDTCSIDSSLRRVGTGWIDNHFRWEGPAYHSKGAFNAGQAIPNKSSPPPRPNRRTQRRAG